MFLAYRWRIGLRAGEGLGESLGESLAREGLGERRGVVRATRWVCDGGARRIVAYSLAYSFFVFIFLFFACSVFVRGVAKSLFVGH